MKSSLITVVIIGSLVFTLGSCGKASEPSSSDTGSGQVSQAFGPDAMEKNAPKVEETIAKVGEKLKEEPSYRACIARSTQMCGSEVVSRFVNQKESDEACEVFEDEGLKSACITGIDSVLAQRKMDTSYCQKIPGDGRRVCEQQVIVTKAMKQKDISICKDLEKTDAKKWTGSVSLPISDTYSECLNQVIMRMEANEKNLELCATIKSDSMRTSCTMMMQSRIEMQKNMPVPPTLPKR